MREIGGYLGLDQYMFPMLHEKAIALNCGRNCLAYLIKVRHIEKILLPKFLCDSISEICRKENVAVRFYSIGIDFMPKDVVLNSGEWIYIVNYYGQLNQDKLLALKEKYHNVIVDQAQAYYQMPEDGIDTLYTCRKYFGVADGAFLYTNVFLEDTIPQDISYDRMRFLHGRMEVSASCFYEEYVKNNEMFANEPIKEMSELTKNLLHGIDYDFVKKKRNQNFVFLHEQLHEKNRLSLIIPEGAFMYPLYVSGGRYIRRQLQKEKIYVPLLWPNVIEDCSEEELEYGMASDILPLPIDQRYGIEEMSHMVSCLKHMGIV